MALFGSLFKRKSKMPLELAFIDARGVESSEDQRLLNSLMLTVGNKPPIVPTMCLIAYENLFSGLRLPVREDRHTDSKSALIRLGNFPQIRTPNCCPWRSRAADHEPQAARLFTSSEVRLGTFYRQRSAAGSLNPKHAPARFISIIVRMSRTSAAVGWKLSCLSVDVGRNGRAATATNEEFVETISPDPH
jgi:hypothetical protein